VSIGSHVAIRNKFYEASSLFGSSLVRLVNILLQVVSTILNMIELVHEGDHHLSLINRAHISHHLLHVLQDFHRALLLLLLISRGLFGAFCVCIGFLSGSLFIDLDKLDLKWLEVLLRAFSFLFELFSHAIFLISGFSATSRRFALRGRGGERGLLALGD